MDKISIHALLAESDWKKSPLMCSIRHFYPRSPCGERPVLALCSCGGAFISIHALLAESDSGSVISGSRHRHFYPRSPCGERRPTLFDTAQHTYFYPRSPCGERRGVRKAVGSLMDFYPRSPCGERHDARHQTYQPDEFLSTLSLRRATRLPTALRTPHQRFLSTLSLRRATGSKRQTYHICEFLSTLSLRRATRVVDGSKSSIEISIHALLAESDLNGTPPLTSRTISIHALLAESDCRYPARCVGLLYFYPRSPCGERPLRQL